MKQYYFISGLPRTCSTLLCNIFAQNPEVFVTKSTSGCHDVLFNIRNQWDNLIEHQAQDGGVNYEQLRKVMWGALENYHLTDKQIIIDKGRGWLSVLEMIEFVMEKKAKVIVPVRDVAEILASFEQLWRKTTGSSQWAFESAEYFKAQTIEGRCEIWAGAQQPIGLAYNRVKDAIARGLTDRLLFVEMDNLTRYPEIEMKRIYKFLELDYFKHNFDNVEQVTKEDDINIHRIPGLHNIRSKVEPVPRKAPQILGANLCKLYSNLEVWRNLK